MLFQKLVNLITCSPKCDPPSMKQTESLFFIIDSKIDYSPFLSGNGMHLPFMFLAKRSK